MSRAPIPVKIYAQSGNSHSRCLIVGYVNLRQKFN